MKLQDKIGFLGGGMMAEALIKGIIEAGLVVGSNILAVDPAGERRKLLSETYEVITAAEPEGLASCSIVILAVKPQVMAGLLSAKRQCFNDNQLVISIAAGIFSPFPIKPSFFSTWPRVLTEIIEGFIIKGSSVS